MSTVVNRTELLTNLNILDINLFVLSQLILSMSQALVLQELKGSALLLKAQSLLQLLLCTFTYLSAEKNM